MVVLVVDVANVMGSRPDGWWRDRVGAAERLLASMAPLAGAEAVSPDDVPVQLSRVVAVLEGEAKAAVALPPEVEVVLAPADGDSAVLAAALEVLAGGETPMVITADRLLRARLPDGSLIAGPRWLLSHLH
jgi:hypothetical protein